MSQSITPEPKHKRRSQPPHGRREIDPFRVLALIGIGLGLLIVVFSAVVWYLTNRENTGIMTMGVGLATAGGLKEGVERLLGRLPSYYQPDPDPEPPLPTPPVRRRRPPREPQ